MVDSDGDSDGQVALSLSQVLTSHLRPRVGGITAQVPRAPLSPPNPHAARPGPARHGTARPGTFDSRGPS